MIGKTGLGINELLQEQRFSYGDAPLTQILAIAQKHGAYNVRVFGSVARGEAASSLSGDLLQSNVEFNEPQRHRELRGKRNREL